MAESEAAGEAGGRAHRAAVAAVVAAGAALRLAHLDQPIRYDEAVTALRYVSLPPTEALAVYDLPNNHVFHTLLARLSVEVFGDTAPALRLPAWTAGVLVVPATYAVGRALRGARVGLLAAALAAASPVLVLFSANARGYSLVVLAALGLAGAASVLSRRRSLAAAGGFVGAAALGAWTIPIMLYPAVAAAAWWGLASVRRGRPVGETAASVGGAGLAAAGLTALLYLPVARDWGVEAIVANRFVLPRPWPEFAAGVPPFLADVGREWAHGVPAWAVALAGAGAAAEGAAWISGRRSGPAPLFPVWAAAALVVLAATRRTPFARVWLFLLPPFLIFAASGLVRAAGAAAARLPRGLRRTGVPAAAALLPPALAVALGAEVLRADAVSGWGLTGTLPGGERVAEEVARRWEPGDGVLAELPSDAPLRYHLRDRAPPADAVGRAPAVGGCAFAVVNRRHGQTLRDVAGTPAGRPRLLGSWEGTALYGWAVEGDRGHGSARAGCSDPDAPPDGARRRPVPPAEGSGPGSGPARGDGWRAGRPADTFAATGRRGARRPDGRGERQGSGRTTERAGAH